MVNYLTLGLLGSSTSLLSEGFSLNVIHIKLYFHLNDFSVNSLVGFSYLQLISNKIFTIKIFNKYTNLTASNKNKLVNYTISNNSHLNKINVN